LAAAASVALLAVVLVRQIPREEYQAVRPPEATRPTERPDSTSAEPEPQAEILDRSAADATGRTLDTDEHEVDAEERSRDMAHRATRDAFQVRPDARFESGSTQERELSAAQSGASEPASWPGSSSPGARARPGTTAAKEASRSDANSDVSSEVASATSPGAPAAESSRAPAPTAAVEPTSGLTAVSPLARRADGAAGSLPPELAARVQSDAAHRQGVEPASIRIVAVDPVMWLDSSLGCDAPRESAPETRVPGYVVTVDASGTVLRYHTDVRDRVTTCEDR
jgi:hypothetical protein